MTQFELTGDDAVNIRFLDSGTGASSYTIQSSPDMKVWGAGRWGERAGWRKFSS